MEGKGRREEGKGRGREGDGPLTQIPGSAGSAPVTYPRSE